MMLVDVYDNEGNYLGLYLMEAWIDPNFLAELALIEALLTFKAAFGDRFDDFGNDFGNWDDSPTALVHVPGAAVQRRDYIRPAGYVDVNRIVAEALATG